MFGFSVHPIIQRDIIIWHEMTSAEKANLIFVAKLKDSMK